VLASHKYRHEIDTKSTVKSAFLQGESHRMIGFGGNQEDLSAEMISPNFSNAQSGLLAFFKVGYFPLKPSFFIWKMRTVTIARGAIMVV
jgi:hypothetical protein